MNESWRKDWSSSGRPKRVEDRPLPTDGPYVAPPSTPIIMRESPDSMTLVVAVCIALFLGGLVIGLNVP